MKNEVHDAHVPSESPMIRTIAMPADSNAYGDIFGGWLMSQMDLAAGNLAARVAQGRCVTISVDGMSFLKPVKIGDEVSVYCSLISTGRTSMKISVEAWRRARNAKDEYRVTKALFTFVAIDDNGRPRELVSEATFETEQTDGKISITPTKLHSLFRSPAKFEG
jgi:acyl-CoA thioesterase YciA